MRVVTYKSLLDRVAAYLGEAEGLDREDAGLALAKVNLFVRLGWEAFFHPESMTVERRVFRSVYGGGVWAQPSTTAAVEVYSAQDGQYYQALAAGLILSGAGQAEVNAGPPSTPGVYLANGLLNGRPFYGNATTAYVQWTGARWECWAIPGGGGSVLLYTGTQDVATPDLVTVWVADAGYNPPGPGPTVANLGAPVDANGVVNKYWAGCAGSYGGSDWVSGRAYTVGETVRSGVNDRYYQCFRAHTSGGSLDGTAFGVLTNFVRSIGWEQAYQADGVTAATVMGLVRYVWDRDPRVGQSGGCVARPQGFLVRAEYLQVLGVRPVVWVEFQGRAPVYGGAVRTDVATYAAGVEVYDTATGDYWVAAAAVSAGESPTSTPSKWTRVGVPYYLAEYVAQSVYAALVDREEEVPENWGVEQGAGWGLLRQEMERVERMEGQVRQLRVVRG